MSIHIGSSLYGKMYLMSSLFCHDIRALTFYVCRHTATGCHAGSHSVICHPAEVTIPLYPSKAGTRFSDPVGMQGWINLVGLLWRDSLLLWLKQSHLYWAPTGDLGSITKQSSVCFPVSIGNDFSWRRFVVADRIAACREFSPSFPVIRLPHGVLARTIIESLITRNTVY